MDPASPADEVNRAMNGYFENWSSSIQPQVDPFGQLSPKICGLLLRGILKPSKVFCTPGHIESGGECVSQTAVLLIPVDQPQRHSLLVRVEV